MPIQRGEYMALDVRFLPVLNALKYVFEEPGGVFMMAAVTADNGFAEQLTIAPPSSLKAFRNADNKSELLNLGLAGNGLLSRRISAESQAWLVSLGWQPPQEPFNQFYAMTGRGDLALDELLAIALESWVTAYAVTPNTPIAMHLSLEQQNHIAANFLDMDAQTFVFTIPGFEPNIRLEPAPPKKSRAKKKPVAEEAEPKTEAARQAPAKTEPAKAQALGGLRIGDRATFMAADASGKPVRIEGTIVGEADGKARFEVRGSQHLPDNVYVLPWDALK